MRQSLPEELRQKLERKRLIFTITSGRSGTRCLAKLLEGTRNITSLHEARPAFQRHMRAAQGCPERALEFWLSDKLPAIATDPNPIYIETSHVFCKGFIEPLLDLGIVPDAIILTRLHREVALSLYRLGSIPGRSERGLHWLLLPTDPGVLALSDWRKLHDYQLCYWYCLEIERRQRIYETILRDRGAKVLHLSIYEMRTLGGLQRLLKFVGIPKWCWNVWLRFCIIKWYRVNRKSGQKTHASPGEQRLDEMEDQVIRLVKR